MYRHANKYNRKRKGVYNLLTLILKNIVQVFVVYVGDLSFCVDELSLFHALSKKNHTKYKKQSTLIDI